MNKNLRKKPGRMIIFIFCLAFIMSLTNGNLVFALENEADTPTDELVSETFADEGPEENNAAEDADLADSFLLPEEFSFSETGELSEAVSLPEEDGAPEEPDLSEITDLPEDAGLSKDADPSEDEAPAKIPSGEAAPEDEPQTEESALSEDPVAEEPVEGSQEDAEEIQKDDSESEEDALESLPEESGILSGNAGDEEDPAEPVSIESANVSKIANPVYNGKEQTPELTVTITAEEEEKTLEEGKDFTVSFLNNVNAGTATVVLTGIGDYTGTLEKTFKIKKAPLSTLKLKHDSKVYTGKAITQSTELTVTALLDQEEKQLERNKDFKISYKNNTKVGTATVTISGKGNYTGTLSGKFKITPRKIKSVTLASSALIYNGKERTQTSTLKVRAWINGGWADLARKDFTFSYKNNTKVGKASITVKGKGNYSGSITKTFKIIPKSTSLKSLSTGSGNITANWKAQTTETTGYQLQYSTKSDFSSIFKNAVVKTGAVNVMKNGFEKGEKYYVRIRTYKNVSGTNYYSRWSAAKSITLTKNKITITGSGVKRTLTLTNPTSVSGGLKAAVWSNKNDQDDLSWQKLKKAADGSWTLTISAKNIWDAGKCTVHVYTEKGTFLKGGSFKFTEKEIEKAGGMSLVRKYARAVLAACNNTLLGAYNWAVNNIAYQSMVVPMTLPTSGPYAAYTRQELYFIYAYENSKGNCFCYAASVYWCAKELGYDVKLIEGQCVWSYGGYGPHSWVELYQDGGTYILDPEIQHEKGWDGYMKTYSNGPDLGYRPDLAAY